VRDPVAAFADPQRRRILGLLAGGELSVTELASHFDCTRSAVSQHLRVLADAGLVDVRKAGRFRFYRQRPEGISILRTSIESFWAAELAELATPRRQQQGGDHMTVEKSVVVPLNADETFALLTEPERLRRWQAVTARIDLKAGGAYRWTVSPGHSASGQVVEIDPGRHLSLSFGWDGSAELPPGASMVTITLEPVEGGTKVSLVHDGLPDDQGSGHLEGWTHYLDRLVVAASKGDAGADPWCAAPDPMEPLSAAEASLALCQLMLRKMGDDSGALPTPCALYSVADLEEHLLGSISSLGGMAGASIASPIDGSFESRVADAGQEALEAWRKRGIGGEVDFGGQQLPATMAANILTLEFFVHAWDFASASSQEFPASPELAEHVLGIATQIIAPNMRDGDRFGPVIEVGADANAVERLMSFTGRSR